MVHDNLVTFKYSVFAVTPRDSWTAITVDKEFFT